MEGYHSDQYWFWMKRRQILTSNLQLQASNGNNNKNNSWEERAFAEDAARNILNGSIWPPRSYSCNFCKREFRSAQALGGHMNIHRRDRARLKQNHDQESLFDHHHQKKNINNDFGNHYFSSKIMSSHIDSYNHYQIIKPCSTRRRSISPSRMISSSSSSLHNDCVETSLSLGLTSMFGQKTSSSNVVPCEEKVKRLKTTNNISSLHSVFFKTCSNDHHHGMEDLDLELRLGKQQKVK